MGWCCEGVSGGFLILGNSFQVVDRRLSNIQYHLLGISSIISVKSIIDHVSFIFPKLFEAENHIFQLKCNGIKYKSILLP